MTTKATPSAGMSHIKAPHLHKAWQDAESICIKCGFCLPACPTYRQTGIEAHSPRGRLELFYAAASGRLEVSQILRPLHACLGCLACETACPSAIRYHHMLDAARSDAAQSEPPLQSKLKTLLMDGVLLNPRRRFLLAWMLAFYHHSGLRKLVGASQLLRLAPGLRRKEANIPVVSFPKRWRSDRATSVINDNETVFLFTGCVMDTVFGHVHAATEKVLRANGLHTGKPSDQDCCGALHHHAGRGEKARELAKHNIEAFGDGEEPILLNSAGCGALLKEYHTLFQDDPTWKERAQRFSNRVKDVSEYLMERGLTPPTQSVSLRVVYDDPCHLIHAQGVSVQPRQLLDSLPGIERIELTDASSCCGSAGTYSLSQPEMSSRLLEQKIENIAASGAEVVASGNPGCLLHLRLGVWRSGLPVDVVHPIELLARGYDDESQN